MYNHTIGKRVVISKYGVHDNISVVAMVITGNNEGLEVRASSKRLEHPTVDGWYTTRISQY